MIKTNDKPAHYFETALKKNSAKRLEAYATVIGKVKKVKEK